MSNSVMRQVLSQALLGTEQSILKVSDFPEALQPSIALIQSKSLDTEQSFLQVGALLMAQDQVSASVDINSFSVEQMAQYQHSLEQGKQDADKDSHANAIQAGSIQDADPLVAKVKMHVGAVPLAVFNSASRPEFPPVVTQLIQQAITAEPFNAMLYWLLKKLSAYDMCIEPKAFVSLSQRYFDWRQDTIKVGIGRPIFSRFMLQELILKVGGDKLTFLLPLYNKDNDLSTFIEENVGSSEVDYARLFSKATERAKFGIFVKLRYDNPALARKLLAEHLSSLSSEAREMIIRVMMINLSGDDEEFLNQVLFKDRSYPCREVARLLLGRIPNSAFSKGCAELCSKYLSFDGQDWHLTPMKYDVEFEALGIDKECKKLKGHAQTNNLIEDILKGMSWPDLRALSKADDDQTAFERWAKFASSPSAKSVNLPLKHIFEERVEINGEVKTIIAYLNSSNLSEVFTLVNGEVFNYLDFSERSKYVAQFEGRIASRYWFVELGDDPREFKPINDQWGEDIFQYTLTHTKYRAQDLDVTFFGMFLSYSFIPWCEKQISTYKSHISELENQLVDLPDDVKNRKQGYELRSKVAEFEAKMDLTSRVLAVLQIRQNIETTLESALGTPPSSNSAS